MPDGPCAEEDVGDLGREEVAYVALGSNLGDSLARLRQAKEALRSLGRWRGGSSLYRTAPVGGPPGQPDYLNAVVAFVPDTPDPVILLDRLLATEHRHGRRRRVRWEARTLDLDLLAFGRRVLATERLVLPHPRLLSRAFVLAPLCELDPDWRHPLWRISACEALARLSSARPDSAPGVVRTDLVW